MLFPLNYTKTVNKMVWEQAKIKIDFICVCVEGHVTWNNSMEFWKVKFGDSREL